MLCNVAKLVTQAGIAPAMNWNPIYKEPAACLPSNCKPSLLLFILLRVTVHAAESKYVKEISRPGLAFRPFPRA